LDGYCDAKEMEQRQRKETSAYVAGDLAWQQTITRDMCIVDAYDFHRNCPRKMMTSHLAKIRRCRHGHDLVSAYIAMI
jgi:hypothetical protein